MNAHLLSLYHALPATARTLTASLCGWYLKAWRSGAARARLAEETLERDRWSASQWQSWREERLAFVLHRAATTVPYYRQYWAARRRHGDQASWELLENWPLLEKEPLRVNPRGFLAEDCDPRRMLPEQTSGTTGTPLQLWRSRATLTTLYAIATTRTRGWDGVPQNARWARLGGRLVTPVPQRRPPFWVWNAAMRQLYMSSYHLAPDLIPHYLDALARYRVAYISGYPSAIQALAREAIRLGRRDLRLLAVYTNAEALSPEQRQAMAAAFQCPVRQTYGMAESVAAASECAAGRLHQWPEIGHIERLPDGELMCTGLLNADMPLIRYRVGDRGRLVANPTPCSCGRTLPALETIEGRSDEVLVTADGRTIGSLDPIFDGMEAIREAQIIQEQLDLVRVRVAPAPGFSDAHERSIAVNVRERMGEVRVLVERVDVLPRSANGKLRAVLCQLTAAQRQDALARSMSAAVAHAN
jgi:phenylacetate-CoA ligase